jgi:heme/copper-type cytochrome/quinol oxidase subunit 2
MVIRVPSQKKHCESQNAQQESMLLMMMMMIVVVVEVVVEVVVVHAPIRRFRERNGRNSLDTESRQHAYFPSKETFLFQKEKNK